MLWISSSSSFGYGHGNAHLFRLVLIYLSPYQIKESYEINFKQILPTMSQHFTAFTVLNLYYLKNKSKHQSRGGNLSFEIFFLGERKYIYINKK